MLKKIFSVLLVCSAAVVISSCSGKLRPVTADLVKAEPQPLEVVGSKVPVTVSIAFPAKWFNKKAELTVKPVLRYATGESWGPSFLFQGEKVLGNERVVSYDNGGNQQLVFSFPYKPAMDKSELFLTFEAKVKGKKINLPDLKIAVRKPWLLLLMHRRQSLRMHSSASSSKPMMQISCSSSNRHRFVHKKSTRVR